MEPSESAQRAGWMFGPDGGRHRGEFSEVVTSCPEWLCLNRVEGKALYDPLAPRHATDPNGKLQRRLAAIVAGEESKTMP